MQAHARFENDKAFCLANVFRCVFIPTVRIKNPGFLLVNQSQKRNKNVKNATYTNTRKLQMDKDRKPHLTVGRL